MTNIGHLSIALTSPPDREFLVAELSVGGEQIAEINREAGRLEVELYGRRDGAAWELPFLDLQAAIATAAAMLEERLGPA